jgi:outer membrane lipase/esterase
MTSESLQLGAEVSATIFFGSSTTDTGDFNATILPVPSPPYFDGRFSNGPVWADYFADLLGRGATASALGGTNYAVGGARTGVVNFGIVPPITAQVSDYLASVGGSADPRALYLLQAGTNDITAAVAQPPETAKQIVADTIAFTELVVSTLRDAGARYFLLLLNPEKPTAPIGPVLPDGTNVVEVMNDGFRAIAADLSGAGVRIGVFDLHGLVAEVVADPSAFGFEVTQCSYMGKSGVAVVLGDTTPEPCEPAVPANKYMMFDDEHYTTPMHALIAKELFACHRFLRGVGTAPPVSGLRCAEGLAAR